MRFNRDFKLTVQISGTQLEIIPPSRISFNATKSIFGGLNKLTVQVYNLMKDNRLALVKDAEDVTRTPLILEIGYDGKLDTLFKGTLHKGTLERKGTDYINNLECLDGGVDFLNSFTSKTVKDKNIAISEIIKDMPDTKQGKVTTQNQVIRPKVLVGNSVKLIEKQLDPEQTYYIDNETLYILKDTDYIGSFVPVISPETGLINTPQRENKRVSFDVLMNPSIKLGGRAELKSTTAPNYNGIYKIEQIVYTGDNYGSDWKQSISGTLAMGYNQI